MAQFYRAVNGNYDPLFLSTPPSTIAFIYKNLGCLHSLQPLANFGDRYADPVVPALKVEGYIMWQTVQLLLGPDEHSEFLRQAVQKWDIKNPETGVAFPKILPRSCFPAHPDSSMVEWYEGMSSRLRREAEEQERIRVQPIEDRPDTPNNSKHHRKISRYSDNALTDDESPPDHKNFAIAYFRDPLFRTIDGRPGLVRNGSRRRPPLSPRDSFVHRSKTVASTFGNVIKHVGSPHLWDGHAATKEKEKDRDHRRRKSLPDKHHYQDLDSDGDHVRQYSRRGSVQDSPPEHHHRQSHHHETSSLRPSPTYHDPNIRHRRPHGPTSPREYFPPVNDENDMRRSSSATHLKPRSTSPQKSGFMPSVSPLFATHVAREGHRPSSRSRQSSARSPERPELARQPGDGGSGSEVGSNRGGNRGTRPKVARFQDSPVGGLGGRKYPVESAYR
ncbi:unnamed protein product [Aureobasidium vineae]|uniref:DUF7514 domain-containing protein n=1 Tax=Aureobasidium vineae TaxID=2773715 RepID=A0A9N8JAW0_9PEZI|nr:unnamed protein product [Aureobasidium vineae]